MSAARRSMDEIARSFVDAFNERDADGLVALSDPAIEFHPTPLVGQHSGYRGHEGLRRWVTELRTGDLGHRARVREVRVLDETSFMLLSEVVVENEVISPSAMLANLSEAGLIVQARAFLSDEELLREIGLLP
jgi:SnoaL-like domain